MKKLLVVAAALVAAASISAGIASPATTSSRAALAPWASASSPRSGDLNVTKDCTPYTGVSGSFCTIKSSNLAALKTGSRITYFQAASKTALNSDIVLYAGPGNTAVGHCALAFATASGVCTFSGGTGKLAGFHARVQVTADPKIPKLWHWAGTYSFSSCA